MTTIATRLTQAAQRYQAGDYAQVVSLCRQVISDDATQADAWCLLGLASLVLGHDAEAIAHCRRASELKPDDLSILESLGTVLAGTGDWAGAVAVFHRMCQLCPSSAVLRDRLGLGLMKAGRHDDAIRCFREAMQIDPGLVDAHNNLGIALKEQGRLAEAQTCFKHALSINADAPGVRNNLGLVLHEMGYLDEAGAQFQAALRQLPRSVEVHNNLGRLLRAQGKLIEAEAILRRAVDLSPGSADGYNNLGIVLRELGHHHEAESAFRQSLALKPRCAEVLDNLGQLLRAGGRLDEAEQCFVQAIEADADFAGARNNLGLIRMERGAFREARLLWEEAIQLDSKLAHARVNLAQLALLQGEFLRSWELFEWRWQVREERPEPRSFDQPAWDGSPLNGRTILLHAEQGLGDTIQFVRYAPLVQERGGIVVLELPRALVPLLQGCTGIDRVVSLGTELPRFDFHAPLMSLPCIFKTNVDTVPAVVPYLAPETKRVAAWKSELDALPGLKVGIVWQGNPRHRNDRVRSVPLAQFAPLARLPGVRLIALQKGPGRQQLPAFMAEHLVTDWGERLDATTGSLTDAAAVLMGVDLLISVDTALAHLAGALARPVWVALPFVPDWRWLLDRDDSPWYPTMRLFRQTSPGDWQGTFARIAQEVPQLAARAEYPGSGTLKTYGGSAQGQP
jgi:Flp pilus assembly protein TadD